LTPFLSNRSKGSTVRPSRGVYVGRVGKPAEGFTAFFVELVYDSGGKYPFKFTTEVSVVPDVLPFSFKTHARSSWKERQNFLQANIIRPYETYSSEGLAAR